MMSLLFLLDVAPSRGGVSWEALILLLVVVFILAVVLMAGLVVLLIWLKRRKLKRAEMEGSLPG